MLTERKQAQRSRKVRTMQTGEATIRAFDTKAAAWLAGARIAANLEVETFVCMTVNKTYALRTYATKRADECRAYLADLTTKGW